MSLAPFRKPADAPTSKPLPPLVAVPSRVENDSIDVFKSEDQLARAATTRVRLRQLRKAGSVTLVCAMVGAGSWFGWQTLRASRTATAGTPAMGTAVFNSSPSGASIVVDGVARGVTPLKLALSAGAHAVTITNEGVSRTLPLSVDAGAVIAQYVELAVERPSGGGRLEIGSEPSGAEVRIDGVLRGVAPLVVSDVAAGQHKVTVSNGETTVNRTVTVTGGVTATVVVSTAAAPAAASAGWLTIDAPFEMEVHEGQRLVGTTRSDRLMLPVGDHDLTISDADLEFVSRRTVRIAAGKTANVSVVVPSGKLSVNAMPWAEVSIDGRPAGTTPLGNLTVPIGSHEILWRHPQLGERRQTVSIKAQSPTRIGVDFSK